jgi:hypothetical protein
MTPQGQALLDEVRHATAADAKAAAEYKGPPLRFTHNGNEREAAMPWLSHVEMAGRVRMLLRDDWTHEATVCAARDRILHLAQENERLNAELNALKKDREGEYAYRIKKQRQRFRHKPDEGTFGDCHRTAVACLFNIDADTVPHFGDGLPEPAEFNRRIDVWLAERNLRQVTVPFTCDFHELMVAMGQISPNVPYLLGGTSSTGVNHTVVCINSEIVCDPSQTDAGIMGPMDDGTYQVTFFCPIDHAAFALPAIRDARVTELLEANNAELERLRAAETKADRLSQCSCGAPLSGYCASCQRAWES